jgi:pyruvate/2-oxoglutarate dehydrogenase complex dihydrolipoamide acyltransferase (E2) component
VVNEKKGFRIVPFGFNRQMVTASAAVSKEKDTIHLITEVDITRPRQLISEHLELTNEKLSLTGYVVSCLARTINEFPQFNSFRKGNRLIILDDLTISVLFEREIDGESVPEPVGIQNATKKNYRQINDELRLAQNMKVEHLGAATNAAWVRFIPVSLLKIFIRLASKSVGMQMRYGVVGVTAVGMFGTGSLWLVPLTNATVTVAIGSISKKPVLIHQSVQEHEFLCLTISFDHDIVDGAPAARFTRRFAELLSSGMEISELMNDRIPDSTISVPPNTACSGQVGSRRVL